MDEEEVYVTERECELLRKNYSDRLKFTDEKIDQIYSMQENIYKKVDRLQWSIIIVGLMVALGRTVDIGQIASAVVITDIYPIYYAILFSIGNVFI